MTPGGPLAGVKVVELAGIGPAPHAAMLLGDLGADVVRVERPRGGLPFGAGPGRDHLLRNRRSVVADLKRPADRGLVLALAERADVLVEGSRPGVAERLGVGPDTCLARNPRLVYARMTGWGQQGPWADRVGHDINYLSVTGVLHAVGRAGERPVPPLNLGADFGGGSMFCVTGILAALVERASSGRGQVVDVAMVDGAALLAQMIWALRGTGDWSDERGTNLLDGGAPFYDTYACADGRHVAVGALEARFYADLLAGLGLAGQDLPAQHDRAGWPVLRQRFTEVFATRDRDDWVEAFDGSEACVTPVLTFAEAATHPPAAARGAHVVLDGVVQPSPAPRFSRTPAPAPQPPREPGADTAAVLRDWGITTG
ncbi:MAG TPA: CaiB/BaiF CoA-transferase family protein [Kineosporiaceae bacterium]